MQEEVKSLRTDFPGTCALEIYGRSEWGRPLYALRIGDSSRGKNVLFQGAIHGREYITARLLLALGRQWLTKQRPKAMCLHILPMTNPDGVVLCQQGRPHWKANARSVDLNRNFPAGWKTLPRTAAPAAKGYKGPFPCSEEESAALALYTLRFPFWATVSYHASGSVIYWEYGQKQPVNALSKELALSVVRATGYPLAGATGLDAGGYKDWAIEALEIPSLTIEVGRGRAPFLDHEFEEILQRNRHVPDAVARWMHSR